MVRCHDVILVTHTLCGVVAEMNGVRDGVVTLGDDVMAVTRAADDVTVITQPDDAEGVTLVVILSEMSCDVVMMLVVMVNVVTRDGRQSV